MDSERAVGASDWIIRAADLRRAGDLEGELDALERALALDPNEVSALGERAAVLAHLRRYEEAVQAGQRVVAVQLGIAIYWVNLGGALKELGRFEEALTAFERGLQLAPNDPLLWAHKGRVLDRLGRYNEAVEACTRAVELAPTERYALVGWADALYHAKRFATAADAYARYVQVAPESAPGWHNRGSALCCGTGVASRKRSRPCSARRNSTRTTENLVGHRPVARVPAALYRGPGSH